MSIETDGPSRESATVFNDGEQIDMHAANPSMLTFKALEESRLHPEQPATPERVLLPHEVVAQFGDHLENFRLWESEMPDENTRRPSNI